MDSFLPQASSFAASIDNLIIMIAVLVGFWFFLAEGIFFWLIFKFKARPGVKGQYITGEEPEQKKWISRPHTAVLVCDVAVIVFAVMVWMNVKQSMPPADETVRIIAQQWAWTFVNPGPDKKLDTPDDVVTVDEMHVINNKTYHFYLESRDVLHDFSVPVFRLKQDAIPGRVMTGWFKPTKEGTFDIQCAEICGIGHGIMGARITIETPEQHAAWMAKHAPVAGTNTQGGTP